VTDALLTAARHIGRGVQRFFRNNVPMLSEAEALRRAEDVTGYPGAHPLWCGECRKPLSPILLDYDKEEDEQERSEIIALACLQCRQSLLVLGGMLGAVEWMSISAASDD